MEMNEISAASHAVQFRPIPHHSAPPLSHLPGASFEQRIYRKLQQLQNCLPLRALPLSPTAFPSGLPSGSAARYTPGQWQV